MECLAAKFSCMSIKFNENGDTSFTRVYILNRTAMTSQNRPQPKLYGFGRTFSPSIYLVNVVLEMKNGCVKLEICTGDGKGVWFHVIGMVAIQTRV